ncbi:splicing factor, CC1-like protein [Patellaria atrata CBS 101060]|uniref:Splicing factor, CC1-like protein n=1 Tax=Patellaria atrata CBS 101060 TaxID=1346257 RepID=A0A9P4SKZ2_9PEZI|nr:splicing factor, CC1-like protein [Patellaria atrata CBS 101060]
MSSGLDVEALLESTAKPREPESAENHRSSDRDDRHKSERSERRDRDRLRDPSRDRDRDRKRRDRSRERGRRDKDTDGDEVMKSPKSEKASVNGSHRSRRRSRSRDSGRHHSRRDRHRESVDPDDAYRASGGDYYRGGGRARSRSRSPESDRYWRPSARTRRDDRDDDKDRDRDRERERDKDRERDRNGGRSGRPRDNRRRSPSPRKPRKSPTPQPTEDERDRRTVFVQQLAARLRTKELIAFFEKVGPVKEAQIVKDRVSGRSKGVGYVEFKDESSVAQALELTGQKLLGIPIIAQLTEAEKNRQARSNEGTTNAASGVPFHRLYVGNIHFSITESDLQNVFAPFGELEFIQLQKDDQGRSRGYGFVQFRDPAQAKDALEKMNGFDLAGRPIRVGLGNDKFTNESTANLLQKFQSPGSQQQFTGSSFSGQGGRGAQAGGSGGPFDRAGGRDTDKGAGGASALDDTDVAGVNFSNFSRDALMRKLARTEEGPETNGDDKRNQARARPEVRATPVNVSQASRCIVLKNMFNPAEEEGESWIKELEDDVKAECEEKYGHVVHIHLDPNTQGDIYVKFDRIAGGENAIKGLNGRFFGGRIITAQPVVDAVYNSLFSHTKAL